MEQKNIQRLKEIKDEEKRLKEDYEKKLRKKLNNLFEERIEIKKQCDHTFPDGSSSFDNNYFMKGEKKCKICGYVDRTNTEEWCPPHIEI